MALGHPCSACCCPGSLDPHNGACPGTAGEPDITIFPPEVGEAETGSGSPRERHD